MSHGRCWGRRVAWTAVVLLSGAALAYAGPQAPNVRLVRASERSAVARALEGAAGRLRDADCQKVLDEFADASGRPLRAALERMGTSAPEYLGFILFYDAPSSACELAALAATAPGSRAVFVCGSRFERQMRTNSGHSEAVLIHEALHSLGLGENPPSSDSITERIRARCGRIPSR